MNKNEKKELGIYIHIPFCMQKCYYCDFVSFSNKKELIEKYIECLISEIRKENIEASKYKVTTMYIGGGTPSYIDSKYIKEVFEAVKDRFDLKDCKEISIEVNPGTVDKEKLEQYKKIGINRISIGLQSASNKLLKQIGRIHTYEQFLDTYSLSQEVGFENCNVDLMLGLPNQSIEDLKQALDKVIKLQPNHISVYSLIVEEGTKIDEMRKKRQIELPGEEKERQMYWYVKNTLELNGYIHYEISNFAKKGKESKHNLNCWEQKEYIGFGLNASSYIDKMRYSKIDNLEEYIKNIQSKELEKNIVIEEEQQGAEEKKEYMLLGLRKIEGVNISKFKEKFIENPIYIFRGELEELSNEELITIDGDNIRLTSKGIDLANLVWQKFI